MVGWASLVQNLMQAACRKQHLDAGLPYLPQ
jgi:hypothetical protein